MQRGVHSSLKVSIVDLSRRLRVHRIVLLAAAWVAVASPIPAPGQLLSPTGDESLTGAGDSSTPVLSGDGKILVFTSSAGNLAPGDVNHGARDVFARSLGEGITELVSANPLGLSGNGPSGEPAVSRDGRWVAFGSVASDLDDGDTNGVADVFVRDRLAGTTRRVTKAPDGAGADAASAFPCITPDGRFIGFESLASNLVAGDTNGFRDVFLFDALTGTIDRLSAGLEDPIPPRPEVEGFRELQLSEDGTTALFLQRRPTSGGSAGAFRPTNVVHAIRSLRSPSSRLVSFPAEPRGAVGVRSLSAWLSRDGRSIAYLGESTAVGAASNTVWWADLDTGASHPVSATWPAPAPEAFTDTLGPLLSADGQTVAFSGPSPDANSNGFPRVVFTWDTTNRVPRAISNRAADGLPSQFSTGVGSLLGASRDLSTIVFLDQAPDALPGQIQVAQIVALRTATGELRRISKSQDGGPGVDTGHPSVSVSDDGLRVAFVSRDSNLVPGDLNERSDVFVYDWDRVGIQAASVRRTTLPSTTRMAASVPGSLGLSADGRFLVFTSLASAPGTQDTNGHWDVFVRDLGTGELLLVSAAANGNRAGNGASFDPSISADGRFVAFASTATDLVEGIDRRKERIFLRDLAARKTLWVSRRIDLPGALGVSGASSVSPDGRRVAFHSNNRSPGAQPVPSPFHLYLFERESEQLSLLTTNAPGRPRVANDSKRPIFSPDGQWLAFESLETNLVELRLEGFSRRTFLRNIESGSTTVADPPDSTPGPVGLLDVGPLPAFSPDSRQLVFARYSNLALGELWIHDLTSGLRVPAAANSQTGTFSADGTLLAYATRTLIVTGPGQVRLKDRVTGRDELVSVGLNGEPANRPADSPILAPDGRFVLFSSRASNLVPNDTNESRDIFLRDLAAGKTLVLSVNSNGLPAGGTSTGPALSADGRTLVFLSTADDLTTGDLNQTYDVFRVRMPGTAPGPPVLALTRLATGIVTVVWAVQPGRSYRLEATDALGSAWTPLAVPIAINGVQASAADAAAVGTGSRFYRVVESEP